MSKELITGVIPTETKPVIFSVKPNEYDFCFMTDSVYSFNTDNIPIKIPARDGFICGKTHENRNIAIYLGNLSFEVFGSGGLNTSAYVQAASNVYDTDIMEYEAICFKGGTLNNVFHINGMKFDHLDGNTVVKHNDDSINCVVEMNDYNMKLDIHSVTNERRGIRGNSINNSEVILTLEFNKPQPLITLFNHYNRMKDLLSFMTFRENVGFEKIALLKTHPEINHLTHSADVFIRSDLKETNKDYFHNIGFKDLGNSLPNLVKLFYDSEDKKQSLSLGFFPSNDRDRNIMNNTKIRAICSALECELGFVEDIKAEENVLLDELIEVARSTIKDYRHSHPGLSNDTYNLIFSSMKHWSFSLAEKLCALYHKYEQEMLILNKSDIIITEDAIKDFVKYRNDITHGKHRVLDMHVALTAECMCGLVYCCILERIGVDKEKIIDLCRHSILQ